MLLDLDAIQAALTADKIDGWLLYDFRGLNPIAAAIAGLSRTHTTRRWYYFIPRSGTPTKLVHAIEPGVLAALPGDTRLYAERHERENGLKALLSGVSTIAMEFSPGGAIPYLSRLDAGTADLIRGFGVRIQSSGDLVGRFEAAWSAAALASHRRAADKLYRIKDDTFAFVSARLSAGDALDEFAIQRMMLDRFQHEGLVTDAPPIVAAGEHTGDPHYEPTAQKTRPYRANELLLLDLWGKIDEPGAVYADITWVGCAGEPPAEVVRVFDAVVAGRDAAVAIVMSRIGAGQPIEGWEVDRAARDVITRAGFGDRFIHRTGHSLGEEVHGNGVHMDDYETHDDRHLVPGTGFTIEPGVYLPAFGIRSEINVVVGDRTAEVTGPRQDALVRIASAR